MTNKTEPAQDTQQRLANALALADRAEEAALNYGGGTALGIEAYASAKTIRAQHDRIAQLEAERDEARAQLAQRQVPGDAIGHVRIDSGELHLHPHNRDAESSSLVDGQLVYVAPPNPPRQSNSAEFDGIKTNTPQRQPLTDERIEALRKKTFSTDNPFCPCDSKTMRKAVWAAEAAHGIKGEDDGK